MRDWFCLHLSLYVFGFLQVARSMIRCLLEVVVFKSTSSTLHSEPPSESVLRFGTVVKLFGGMAWIISFPCFQDFMAGIMVTIMGRILPGDPVTIVSFPSLPTATNTNDLSETITSIGLFCTTVLLNRTFNNDNNTESVCIPNSLIAKRCIRNNDPKYRNAIRSEGEH
jgi:hypothetical protein